MKNVLPHQSVCPLRALLLGELASAVISYSQAALKFSRINGTTAQSECNAVHAAVRTARTISEEAHSALMGHLREHGCKTEQNGPG
jgi:hypothetical protein